MLMQITTPPTPPSPSLMMIIVEHFAAQPPPVDHTRGERREGCRNISKICLMPVSDVYVCVERSVCLCVCVFNYLHI